jgi:hypothetical protein
MPEPDLLVLVGNGLSIDLSQQGDASELKAWNTSRPLAWQVPAPGKPGDFLIDLLPEAKKAIEEAGSSGQSMTDFEIFDTIVRSIPPNPRDRTIQQMQVTVELRHLLAISYSYYQSVADPLIRKISWPWGKYYRSIRHRISGAVSFNYDLNFETLLQTNGFQFNHVALLGSLGHAALFKPHGSIDYGPSPRAITLTDAGYPLESVVELTDAPAQKMRRDKLLNPRTAPDIVLPAEASPYTGFQWVRGGWNWLQQDGHNIRHLIVHGLSYWPEDRQELDFIFDCLTPRTTAIIANPYPNSDLRAALKRRFRHVREWTGLPENLPS